VVRAALDRLAPAGRPPDSRAVQVCHSPADMPPSTASTAPVM
jgi:hypothetical protein